VKGSFVGGGVLRISYQSSWRSGACLVAGQGESSLEENPFGSCQRRGAQECPAEKEKEEAHERGLRGASSWGVERAAISLLASERGKNEREEIRQVVGREKERERHAQYRGAATP